MLYSTFKMIELLLCLSLPIIVLHTFAVAQYCDEVYEVTSGSIFTAGYPVIPYQPNLDCYYAISIPTFTPINTTILFDIIALDLEDIVDYVDIYDGPAVTSLLIGRFTGKLSNYTFYTTTYQALVHFHSDGTNEFTGFNIYFTEHEDSYKCPASDYGDFGNVQSPNYPEDYPNNSDCQYLIETSPTTRIIIHVEYIEIEENMACIFDYIEFYDGPTTNSTLLGKICGSGPVNDILSTTNKLLIIFHSDTSNTYGGFNISFTTDMCQGSKDFIGSKGTIFSLGYPLIDYPDDFHCGYTITTPNGSLVLLHIDYMNVEYSSANCSFDYVRFYDGPSKEDDLMAIYCGSTESGSMEFNDIHASSNQLYFLFHSDLTNSASGFSMTYIANYNTDNIERIKEI